MDSIVKIITIVLSLLAISQIIFLGIRLSSCAQDSNESIIFSNTFGGKSLEIGFSVQETSDGGYIIVGQTFSYGAGSSDIWLVKTDKYGKKEWSQTFGGEDFDVGVHVTETSDGGYIIVGFTQSFDDGERDAWLLKTDNNGELQWDKKFGGTGEDYGRYVKEESDGGYLIEAYLKNKGLVLMKTDNHGNIEWEKDIENGYYSYQQTSDGGYIDIDDNENGVLLRKIDNSSNETWNRLFQIKDYGHGERVQQTSDGGYIILCWTEYSRRMDEDEDSGPGYVLVNDIWIIKTNKSGDEEWRKKYGGKGRDIGNSIQQTPDGGYIIVGSSSSFTKDKRDDILFIKTDSYGNTKLPIIKENNDDQISLWNMSKLMFSITLLIIIVIIYIYDRKIESKRPSKPNLSQKLEKNVDN